MADFKTYSVVYNITANSGEAYQALRQLAEVSKQLGNGKHMQNFNTRIKQLATYAERINKSMNTLSPRIDMGTFKSQLSIMERAVAASASNMRATIQTALSGTPQQFSKAIQGKGSWAKVAEESLRKEQKGIESALKNAKAKIAALRSDLTAGGTYREGANGKKQFLPFSQKDIAKANRELKTLGKTVSSYENRLSALASNLQVLGPAIPASVSKQFQSAGMVSQNVQSLNAMTEAMKKWKDVTKGMKKSQEYIININAKDNTAPIFAKIEERLAAIKSAAASIVIGAASPGAAGKGTGKGGKATTPAPAATQTKAEDILTRGGLRKLKSMAYKTQNLADAFEKNGKWTDKQKELAKQILPGAKKLAGITGSKTAVGDIAKALNEKYDAEKKKYDQYKANKPVRIPKQPKATTVTPQAPVQWPTQGPISVRSTFNGGGAAFGMNQSLGRLQGIANAGGNGVSIRSTFNGGGAAFGMNRSLYTLQELANTRPVSLGSRLDRSGIVARALGGYRTLQTAADQRPITLKSRFDATGLRFGLGRALVELQNMANSRPVTVRANISATGNIPPATATTMAAVGAQGKAAKTIPASPRSAAAIVQPTGGGGGGTSAPIIISGGTVKNPSIVKNIKDVGMFAATKRWFYPITGNTSFGARTPAFVEMAKGMGTMMALGGAMGAVGSSFNQSVDYQNMMTTTRAILGRNYTGNNFERDFKKMEEVIRAEGIQTKFTAPEEAGAAKYLAMAGMDINTIKAAIRPVTNIALAGDMDLPTVADKMTNIMTAFKMKSPAEFVKASDILANTFTKSNTNMMQLAESAQYAAPIAAARGMGLAEMMALVGVMGDSGIQGSMAGTSLRMMMNNIYNPSKNQREMWDQLATLGVSRTDSNGKWLGVTEILNQIASVVPKDKLPDVMGKLFRVTSVAGATQLARNIGRVNELRQSNNTAVGVAESMREARINNVRGKWAQVSSTFTEDMLRIFEKPETQNKIMAMLDKFREMLAKPETIKALESVFDVMIHMANFMAWMANGALKAVNWAPRLIGYMLQMQMLFTAIGSYIITPLVQLTNMLGMVGSPIKSLFGFGGGGVASAAGAAAAGTVAANKVSKYDARAKLIMAGDKFDRAAHLQNMANLHSQDVNKYNAISSRLRKNTQFAHTAPGAFWAMAATAPAIAGGVGNAARAMDNRANYATPGAFWAAALNNPNRIATEGAYAERAARFNAMAMRSDAKAAEAARMAQNYANAAKYGYGYESAFAASMAMSTMAGRQAQTRQGLERMLAQRRRRGAHLGNAELMTRAFRINSFGNTYSKLRDRGENMVSAGWHTLGRSRRFLGSGFKNVYMKSYDAAMITMSFSSLFSSIRGMIAKATFGLASALAKLTTPLGFAGVAIAGMTAAAIAFKSRLDKGKEEKKELEKDFGPTNKKTKALIDKWNNTGLKTSYYKFDNAKKWGGAGKYNPQLKHEKEYKHLFKDGGKSMSDYDYGKQLFDYNISDYSEYLYGKKLSYDEFRGKFYNSWDGQFRSRVRKQAQKGAIYRMMINSNRFKNAQNDALELINMWSQLPSNERDSNYESLMGRLAKIRDSFDYKNGLDLSGKDFSRVRYSDVLNSKQGLYAAWRMLNNLMGGEGFGAKKLFAQYNLSNSAQFSNKWFESFDTVASSIQLKELGNATLEFKNGTANWDKFYENLKKMNIEFENTTSNHLRVLTGIADYISKDPNLKDLEALRAYLSGLINYISNFDANKVLGDFRREMQIMAAPVNVPVVKTVGSGNAPRYIQKPGKTILNSSYFKDADDTKKNSVNSLKYVDQTPFVPFSTNNQQGVNRTTAANNTVNIRIDNVTGADRDSAQLFSEIVGNEIVKTLGIIGEQYQQSTT